MKVFWRTEDLDEDEAALLAVLAEAHEASTGRDNLSSHAVALAAAGSGSYTCAISAALLTLGGPHGPIAQTHGLLASAMPGVHASAMLRSRQRVPGWGNGFVKGRPDPLWRGVDAHLALYFPAIHATIHTVTQTLHAAGIPIFPNPACYTAAAAIATGLPGPLAAYLFVSSRLPAWSKIAASHL